MNLDALSHRSFRAYWAANNFALHGLWVQRVTLGWLAWDMTGQAGFVGLIAFLSFAPTLVSGPFFGVLADRTDLRRAAFIAQSGLAAGSAALLAAHLAGVLGPVALALIAGLIGIVTSAHHPIRMTLGPALVERAALASVVALTSLSFNLARLIGPALGGWLIAGAGVGAALAASLVAFLPLLVVLARLRLPPRPLPEAGDAGVFAALGAGLRHAAGNPLIARAIVLTGVFALVARGTLEILPAVADGRFGRGAAGLGILAASAGGGALFASIAIALGPSQSPDRLPRPALVAALAGLALVALLGRTASWPVAIALVAAIGFCSTLVGVSLQSAVQLALPDEFRGRVMSLWTMVGIGAAAVGAIVIGTAADRIGLGPALSASGVAGVGLAAAIMARRRR
jgi:MFS family permease